MNDIELNKVNQVVSSSIQMLKSALAQIPGMSLFVDLYSNYQQNVQYNNIVDVLTKHSKQIRLITDLIISIHLCTLKTY